MYYWQSPWWKKRPREVSIVPLAAMNTDKPLFAKQASLQLRISYKDQIYQLPGLSVEKQTPIPAKSPAVPVSSHKIGYKLYQQALPVKTHQYRDKLSFIIQSSNSWVVIKEIITIRNVLNKLLIGRFYSFLLQIPF